MEHRGDRQNILNGWGRIGILAACCCLWGTAMAADTLPQGNAEKRAEQFRILEQRKLSAKARKNLQKKINGFVRKHNERVPMREGTFENEKIAGLRTGEFCFALEKETGLPIFLSLKGSSNLLGNADISYPFWELETVDGKGNIRWLGPFAGKFRSRFLKDGTGMLLIYSLPELTVNIRVSPDENGFARFSIHVRSHDKSLRLNTLDFPKLALRPRGTPRGNLLVLPFRRGVLRKLEDAETTQNQRYPQSSARFQMTALYDAAAKKGIYLATDDDKGHAKFFYETYLPGTEMCLYTLRRFPENRAKAGNEVGETFASVAGVFDGDWYDAAQIYRRWWLGRSWARRGPLHTSDVPDYLKRAPVFLRFYLRESSGQTPELMLKASRAWTAFLPGRKIPATLYHYSRFTEPRDRRQYPVSEYYGYCAPPFPGLLPALREMNQAGIRTSVYLQSEIYNQFAEENRELESTRRLDEHGRPQLYLQERAIACRRVPLWRKRYLEMCAYLLNMGFSGIYMDTFGKSMGNYECCDIRHGHAAGGGNIDFVSQMILGNDVRTMVRKWNPDCYIGGEACTEGFPGILDYKLNATHAYSGMIPLERVLYGDYFLSHGRSIQAVRTDREAKAILLDFLEGIIPGRFFGSPPEKESERNFLREVIDRMDAGMDYLRFGQMLRALKFRKESGEIVLKEPRNVRIAAWKNSVFRSCRDTSIGIAVVHLGSGTEENSLILPDASAWNLPPEAEIFRLAPSGKRIPLGKLGKNRELALKLAENGMDFFLVTGK